MKTTGVVEAISKKERNTKRGPATVTSIKVNDEWFNCGFSDPGVAKGDTVEVEYSEGTYGKDVKKGGVTKTAGGSAPTTGGRSMSRGNFPIGEKDGQRSIIRQNALGHAREVVINVYQTSFVLKPEEIENPRELINGMTADILDVARVFEAYADGSMDEEGEAVVLKRLIGD